MEFLNDPMDSNGEVAQAATAAPAAADAVPSVSTLLPPSSQHQNKPTAVDGEGMWRSWTRVFAKPESACLDLLDNCFDAALKLGFRGRVEMSSEHGGNQATAVQSSSSAIVTIQNNSKSRIKPLEAALTVYKSSKNSSAYDLTNDDDKDAIGENGVGLKQGCATLSDCSMVLTRNRTKVEIGIIAKQLQTSAGVCLPSFTFEIQDPAELRTVISRWLEINPEIHQTLATSFGPSVGVEEQATRFAEYLYRDGWEEEEHVFLLVLCNLKAGTDAPHRLIESVSPAKRFLENMRKMLPEHYINLPAQGMFQFKIDKEVVDFSYWQHRLVELTKFEVHVPRNEPFENLPKDDWDKPSTDTYPLSIYCGFDAQRLHQNMTLKQGTSNCILYIYSCQAGRLIKKEIDARHLLGLNCSGVDFTQGLTVIINDVAGKLPLTPTKDGIAWSEQSNGDIHRKNLLSWAGGVANFYWIYHRNSIGKGKTKSNVKSLMRLVIASFVEDQMASTHEITQNMENADFTYVKEITWGRKETGFDNAHKIRQKPGSASVVTGPDTLFQLSAERVHFVATGEKPKTKRKAKTDLNENPNKRTPNIQSVNANTQYAPIVSAQPLPVLNVSPWAEVDPRDIEQISLGVLSFFREKDKDGAFENPVWETWASIKEETYRKTIPNPMCFRDIETERMPRYTSVKQLQDDLILVFQNCLRYNHPSSAYAKLARTLLDSMDEAFESTDIKKIAMRVLNFLRSVDTNELFEVPVIEQCPHLKDAYLQRVQQPMDFRTIEEERIHTYTSKEDLRKDLELIFHNCIVFNSSNDPNHKFFREVARKMLEILDKEFLDLVHGKLGIERCKRKKTKLNYAEIEEKCLGDDRSKAASSYKPKQGTGSIKKQLQHAEKKIHKLERDVFDSNARLRYVEERRLDEVKELKNKLEERNLRIRQLESGSEVSSSSQVQSLQRTILSRDSRINSLKEREVALVNEVAMLKRQIEEGNRHTQQLSRDPTQPQTGDGNHATPLMDSGDHTPPQTGDGNDAIPLMGGVPRTVVLPPGPLGIVISQYQNKFVVTTVSETGAMYGKICPGDILFSVCGKEAFSMSNSDIQARLAATKDQERTLCVITPNNCFLDEGDCSEITYRKARGLPLERNFRGLAAVEAPAQIQPKAISEHLEEQQFAPEEPDDPEQAANDPVNERDGVNSAGKRDVAIEPPVKDEVRRDHDPSPRSVAAASAVENDVQGDSVDLEWLLKHRCNKISDGEKIRIRQFIDRINPTPDQPEYGMKTHVQKWFDAETGENVRESFHLKLNYRDFSARETKKTKRY